MVPARDKGNYLQSLGNQKFMGGQIIRCMVHKIRLGPLQVPKFQVPTTGGICVSGQYRMYPQHSHIPIETPKDEATRIAIELIESA